MSPGLIEVAGWLPALIIPLATLIQLVAILRRRTAAAVSGWTWFLFGIANIGLYIYTEKYTAPQAIIGLLFTAFVDFLIVALVLARYGAARS